MEAMVGSTESQVKKLAKTGLEGTGLDIPPNRHGNLKSASTDQNFKEILTEIKTSKAPAVINYGASWCRICSQILPSFCRLSNNFPKISFIYVDIDECPELLCTFGIHLPFNLTKTVRGWIRCLVLEKSSFMTGCGCTLEDIVRHLYLLTWMIYSESRDLYK